MQPETRKRGRISGIVRHYHTPNSKHMPYRGKLKDNDDREFEEGKPSSLWDVLKDFPDGEYVVITIEGKGPHPNADGHVWMLTKPHTYERVPIEQWKQTFVDEHSPESGRTNRADCCPHGVSSVATGSQESTRLGDNLRENCVVPEVNEKGEGKTTEKCENRKCRANKNGVCTDINFDIICMERWYS